MIEKEYEESKDDIVSQASKDAPKFTLFIKNMHLDVEEEDL